MRATLWIAPNLMALSGRVGGNAVGNKLKINPKANHPLAHHP
nr:hypothetical protein [Candidatus Parabeggiatoa sp.]